MPGEAVVRQLMPWKRVGPGLAVLAREDVQAGQGISTNITFSVVIPARSSANCDRDASSYPSDPLNLNLVGSSIPDLRSAVSGMTEERFAF